MVLLNSHAAALLLLLFFPVVLVAGKQTIETKAPQTTQIVSIEYYDSKCTNPVMNQNQTFTAGSCESDDSDSSRIYYCSSDGLFVYLYTYSDSACSTLLALNGIEKMATGCGGTQARFAFQCLNPSLGPESPLPFPPPNWLIHGVCSRGSLPAPTFCSNTSDPSENLYCYQNAVPTGVCMQPVFSHAFQQFGCNADGTAYGYSFYSDAACSNPIGLYVFPTICIMGAETFCAGSNPLPTLPTIGYTSYDETTDCAKDQSHPVSTVVFTPGLCLFSQQYECQQINGVEYGTLIEFSDPTKEGLCPPTSNTTTSTQPAGICVNGRIFHCDSTLQSNIQDW